MSYYYSDTVKAERYHWDGPMRTYVMHGTFNGKFVALTIRIPGSSWICHPSPDGDSWNNAKSSNKRVPRWVRKEAKMALRRWLG